MISIDNLKATMAGTNYLISHGYQRIALVAVDTNDPQTGRTRCAGYQKAMESARLTPSIIPGDYSFAAGKKAVELLLAKGELPEAIFAASDDAAAGVIYTAQEHGIKVPEQLAVLGFDNSSVASMIYPGITTIDQPFKPMGQLAIEHLTNQNVSSVELPYQIKERGSVAKYNSAQS